MVAFKPAGSAACGAPDSFGCFGHGEEICDGGSHFVCAKGDARDIYRKPFPLAFVPWERWRGWSVSHRYPIPKPREFRNGSGFVALQMACRMDLYRRARELDI